MFGFEQRTFRSNRRYLAVMLLLLLIMSISIGAARVESSAKLEQQI